MKKGFSLRTLFIGFIILAILLKIISKFYVDFSWFQNLGYSQLYLKPIMAKVEIGVIAFLIYFVITFLAAFVGYRSFMRAENFEQRANSRFHLHIVNKVIDVDETGNPVKRKTYLATLVVASLLLSLFFTLATTTNGWMKLLEFQNATAFNLKDMIFNRDIAFYVFQIPFYNFVLNALTFSLGVIFLISVLIYFFTGLVRVTGNLLSRTGLHIPPSIRKFWSVLAAILFLLIGFKNYLSMYAVMYSQYGYVTGAGYTDIHVTVPLAKVLTVVALLCGIASLVYFFIDNHRILIRTIGLYLVIAILGTLVQSLVQYNVSNNEFTKEQPYIKQEIKYTQIAYNLENIQLKDYPGLAPITQQDIQSNRDTLDNVRLNDPVPLKAVLSQNQGLRYYYRFNDIDVDRYMLDGKYRQVLLSGREISNDALVGKAGTFVNLTMRYTHGYGVAATLANEIDNSGYAKLIVKDIPPESSMQGIKIKEPRIYFGELTDDPQYGYVIGNSATKEFDYPQGDNNVENSYQGKTGLPLNPINKFFLSTYFSTFRLYLAGEVNQDSKLLMRRNILERVQTLMPYLQYDQDPYLVIAENGKLYWMIDAYTTTDKFPYSAPYGDMNYVRNSVKVVVDAYNGNVDFYVFDPKDPILQTIRKIFPGVFKDKNTLPSNLIDHVRYPEDLFSLQSQVLLNFHVNNPSVFYNKEDTWDVAKRVDGNSTVDMKPYYSILQLPGEQKSEYTLMLPFTPASRSGNSRNNMVAWLAARNDGDHYGELQLYRMPKNIEIQGPLMIDSLIDQDTNISQKMTLWGQGGSEVIRGNLLVVPINDSFVYIEPIYIKAGKQGASIPQMQAIVFAIDKDIVMVETKSLDKAIQVLFEKTGQAEPPAEQPQPSDTASNTKEQILQKIDQIKQQLQVLEQAIKGM